MVNTKHKITNFSFSQHKENKKDYLNKFDETRAEGSSCSGSPTMSKIDEEISFSDVQPLLKTIEDYQKYICGKNKKFSEEFILEQILSKGSFGVLLKGKSKKYKKNFAFKLIFNKKVINQKREKCLNKIKDEISIQHKLKNKNINQFYGFYEIADSFCYVLEHERYGDLGNFMKLLKRQTLSESLMAYMAVQILNGLKTCHNNKIAHLDIKKQNILVDESLNFKLCDFSVSTEYGDNDIKLHCVGSSLYISYENLTKMHIPNEQINKVDVYSFGVLLYNLAFKCYPYNLTIEDSSNFEKIAQKIKEEELTFPLKSNYSPLFKDFLFKLLQKDINQRISVVEALNHPWIAAAKELVLEREKVDDVEKFLVMLITDNVRNFNQKLNICEYGIN